MRIEQLIFQVEADQKYAGKFVLCSSYEYSYTLVFSVPMSMLAEEIQRRESLGEDVSSLQIKQELFLFTMTDEEGNDIDTSNDILFDELIEATIRFAFDFREAPVVQAFNKLFHNLGPHVSMERAGTISENVLPFLFPKKSERQAQFSKN